MATVRGALARAAAFAETRAGAITVFGVALAVWWIQAIAMPLVGGRDFGTYLGAFVELFQSDPIDLGYVLGRTPIASLVTGGLLVPFGGALAEPVMSLLYAASILAWFLAARTFAGGAGLLAAGLLLVYPSYGILFHELASDSVYAAGFAGWSLLAVHVLTRPSTRSFALLGSGVAALVLIRPVSQALVLLALLALVVAVPWRLRLRRVVAYVVPVVAVIAAWTLHNGLRFDDYTLARGGRAFVIYRTYLVDKIVRPDNGPASQDVARAVEEDLLPREPYRSYGITLDRFFEDPTPRMLEDLGALTNRRWGWHSDQRILRDVAVEAIRTHPVPYARGVARSFGEMLQQPVYRALGSGGGSGAESAAGGDGSGETVVVNGNVLPKPSEGEAIPAAREGGPTTPDNSIRTVWTSPYEHHLVFDHAGDRQRYDALHERMDDLATRLPRREGNATLALRLNQASRWFPPPALWLLIGIVALAVRRPGRKLALSTPAVAGLLLIGLSALGLPAVPHYAVPVAPAFALFMSGALFGARASRVRQRSR
jgi:hypothetical protein